jgi:hypothetical protein
VSDEREHNEEGFLRRWSRVKSEARENPAAPSSAAATPPAPAAVTAQPNVDPAEPMPQLPAIDELTLDSDFSGFFHPKVDENVRRQALHKLFSDPHFNVMDGLDVYIDDYSKTEPIPAAMLASLKQAQRILEWAAEKPAEKQGAVEAPPSTAAEPQLTAAGSAQLTTDIPPAVRVEPDSATHDKSIVARDHDS